MPKKKTKNPRVLKSSTKEEEEFLYFDGSAEDAYEEAGFVDATKRPSEEPTLPDDMAGLSNAQLSNIINLYSRWREYAEGLYNRAMPKVTMLQEKYDFEYAKLYVSLDGKPTEKKETVLADVNLYKLRQEHTQAKLYMEMVAAKIESYTNILTLLSREVSLRRNT